MSSIQQNDDISSSKKHFYVFESGENITAQELAKLLPLLIVALKDQDGNVGQFVYSKEIPSELNHVIETLPSDLRKYFIKEAIRSEGSDRPGQATPQT